MIEVIDPGFYSSIQDSGRFGYRHLGVPVSGSMDKKSMNLCNRILFNEKNAAVMEICLKGPKLEFHKPTVICLCGADFQASINQSSISLNTPYQLYRGDILEFSRPLYGIRTYLGIKNGFQSEIIIGSRSMSKAITPSERLIKGDMVNYAECDDLQSIPDTDLSLRLKFFNSPKIPVYKGPEYDKLSKQLKNKLFNTEFSISKFNNRMAYQLEENFENQLDSILTSAVMPGTVQLTPSGKMIILMRDCQTTGGYPRILQLSNRGINMIAQKFNNQKVRFIKAWDL